MAEYDNVYYRINGLVQEFELKGDIDERIDYVKEEIKYEFQHIQKMNKRRGVDIPDEWLGKIQEDIRANLTISMGDDFCPLKSNNCEPWLDDANVTWNLWRDYKNYLVDKKGWNDNVMGSLHRHSSKIVDLLGNPNQQDGFERFGLVMGDVQSGKTAMYTAIASKAIDAGYKIVIILAGTKEDLRSQTQSRMDTELVGHGYVYDKNAVKWKEKTLGVKLSNPEHMDITSFTSAREDFNANAADANRVSMKMLACPVLFVVKKCSPVLKNLLGWLDKSKDQTTKKIMYPALIFDDECDEASINTMSHEEATAINGKIRELVSVFYKSNYIGVTATPFANILIPPTVDDDINLEPTSADDKRIVWHDLFPQDFIYALDVPSNYTGVSAIFGNLLDDDGNLRTDITGRICLPPKSEIEEGSTDCSYMLAPIDYDALAEKIPRTRADIKAGKTVTGLPDDMQDALRYFILLNGIFDSDWLKFRKMNKHRSMLVNVSPYVDIHEQLGNYITTWLENRKAELFSYGCLDWPLAGEQCPELQKLHDVFEKQCLEKLGEISWKELLPQLHFSTKSIKVIIQNANSPEKLDYAKAELGLRAIAIGGYSFSRGLTLENLCVSYYDRTSICYDTLLQMGRWFGYRDGYKRFCRIFMTEESIKNYVHLNTALQDLRKTLLEMNRQGLSPKEFGLRIMLHSGMLQITAANKMRWVKGNNITLPVNLAHSYISFEQLHDDETHLNNNEQVIREFVAKLPVCYDNSDGRLVVGTYFWQDVDHDLIKDLLNNFNALTGNEGCETGDLARYVAEHDDIKWDVSLHSVAANEAARGVEFANPANSNGNLRVGPSVYSEVFSDGKVIKLRNGKGLAVRERSPHGLTKKQKAEVIKAYKERKQKENKPIKANDVPDIENMIEDRNHLLVLHLIRPKMDGLAIKPEDGNLIKDRVYYSMAVGIPGKPSDKKIVKFLMNQVKMQQVLQEMQDRQAEYDDSIR